jgi:hypothetical protein
MPYRDAFDRISELRRSTRKLFDEYVQLSPGRQPALLKKILLALELRWKLEELVLIPALRSSTGDVEGRTQEADRELSALRDMAVLAKEPLGGPERERMLVGALEALAGLRTERVGWALSQAQRAALVDARALGREMDQLLDRWRSEVRRTGDIEDEEADPVGQPPR